MKTTKFYKNFRRLAIFVIQRIDTFVVEIKYFFRRFFLKKEEYSKKSILVLVSQLCNGGAERVAANLCDELSKKFNVILVTYTPPTKNDYNCGVKRIVIDEKKARFFKYNYVVRKLKKIKKKYNITHSISFCSKANYLNVMSKVNDKTIVSIRSYLKYSEVDQQYYRLNKVAGKYSDEEVVVSSQLIDEQVQEYNSFKDKIKVVHNFVDKEKINKYLSEKNDIKLSKNTIINVGRLSNQKGQKYLIKAFSKVIKKVPDAELIILGKGELEEELEFEIKKLHLEKNIKLLGYKTNPYIYMKQASCFVLSSFFEGMPNVVLEAMYLGLPIISTDCISGVREILAPKTDINYRNKNMTKEEYGILVPIMKEDNAVDYLVDAIVEMLQDDKLNNYYRKQSRKRVKDFSKEKNMKEWLNIVKE